MNKAFTKEDTGHDFQANRAGDSDDIPAIPGGKNYITPAGHKRMVKELQQLKSRDRPEITKIIEWAAGNGDRSENGDYLYGKKKLREIDRRIRFLNKRLEAAQVIDPKSRANAAGKIFFGATVTIAEEDGTEKVYSIVGVDEVDVAKGRISWASPLGAALLKATNGDAISFNSPKGIRDIEILDVQYVDLE